MIGLVGSLDPDVARALENGRLRGREMTIHSGQGLPKRGQRSEAAMNGDALAAGTLAAGMIAKRDEASKSS